MKETTVSTSGSIIFPANHFYPIVQSVLDIIHLHASVGQSDEVDVLLLLLLYLLTAHLSESKSAIVMCCNISAALDY